MQTTTKNTMNVIPSPKWAYMSLQIYFIHSGQKHLVGSGLNPGLVGA